MRDLKLVSLSEDGSHLVLTHEGTSEQFALAIDDRVRSAVVSDRARVGQLPLEVESRLRPKEIQARVRAGESSEDIAAAAGVALERILRYAGPVLAEREHIAGLARRCAVRRHGHEGPGAILHQMVESRLENCGFETESLAWDAWRAATGNWTVAAQYTAAGATRLATFDFDPVSRIVVPADDRALVLTGEQSVRDVPEEFSEHDVARAKSGADRGGSERAGQRARLAAVPNPTPADAAAEEPTGTETAAAIDSEETIDLTGTRRRAYRLESPPDELSGLGPDEVADLDQPDDSDESERTRRAATGHGADSPRSSQPSPERAEDDDRRGGEQRTDDHQRRPQRKRRSKRAVVPSWDEILFGAADGNSE